MIPIASPDIGDDEKKAVLAVLSSGIIAEGPKVKEFEQAFANYIGVKHAIAVSSGTSALHAALLAHGIGSGDEVITTPFTFIASANSILFTGAKPLFCDIEEDTYNLDPNQITERITKKTKAIMPVHLYGHPAEMKAIMEIAKDHNLLVIEDACQAHGAEYSGRKVGSFGTGCFSFYPTKNMTSSEGGIITTDDGEVDRKARGIRQHGMFRRYYHEMLGYNLRMTDIAAAIGVEQLKKLPEYNRKRIENAAYLSKNIKNKTFTLPKVRRGCVHVFHQYTVRHKNRDKVAETLKEKGIGCGIYYPVPIHQQPHYLSLGYKGNFPKTERACAEVISLPIHPKLTEENLGYIAETLNSI
ncbi:MAG: DegT/DnrJ/EryC1/StrS family aminotransferase [Candidatus Altiarchaeota archaeon]